MTSRINHLIPGQLSSFINEEYPYFVEFLEGYYEWIETPDSPYYDLRDHLSRLDFKDSLDEYIGHIKNEYLHGLPEKLLADKELMVRYSKQFFQSIGTEKSFKFLFHIVFGEAIEVVYPKDFMFRCSDGRWVEDEHMMYISNTGNVNNFLFKEIKQTREIFPGIFEYASASVNKITQRHANNFEFAEIYVTNLSGTFDLNYPISTVDGSTEWILPICDAVQITSSGLNYAIDNKLTYTGSNTFDIECNATENGLVNARYQTRLLVSDIAVHRNELPLLGYSYDGRFVRHPDIIPGDLIKITLPVYKGFATVSGIKGLGQISHVNLIDTPFGIVNPQSMSGFDGGSGGVVSLQPSTTKKVAGYFSTTDGFLSADKKLQDSEYYQDYSYVIKAGISLEDYKDIVYDVLHPAGLKLIGEISILELIKLLIRGVETYVNILGQSGDVDDIGSSRGLYNFYGWIDDRKYSMSSDDYKTNAFKDIVVNDVITNKQVSMAPLNFHDTSVTIITGE